MIYDYRCTREGKTFEVIKGIHAIEHGERCPDCEAYSERLFSFRGQTRIPYWESGFNPAFGKVFTTRRQLNEELVRYRHTTGKELIEVGNEKRWPTKETPKVDLESAARELNYRWRHAR